MGVRTKDLAKFVAEEFGLSIKKSGNIIKFLENTIIDLALKEGRRVNFGDIKVHREFKPSKEGYIYTSGEPKYYKTKPKYVLKFKCSKKIEIEDK